MIFYQSLLLYIGIIYYTIGHLSNHSLLMKLRTCVCTYIVYLCKFFVSIDLILIHNICKMNITTVMLTAKTDVQLEIL